MNQTDTFEDELAFLKRKNQEIEQDIAEQDIEHARKMAELDTKIQQEKSELDRLRSQQSQQNVQQTDLQRQISQLQSQIDYENSVNQQLTNHIAAIGQMIQRTQEVVQRPDITQENYLQSVHQELKELTNDFIRLLVLAYQDPAAFILQNGAQQYMDLLSRIERKKAQIVYV